MTSCLSAFLALTVAAPLPKAAPPKADPPVLTGVWECTGMDAGGTRLTPDGLTFEFTADGKLVARKSGRPNPVESSYAADPAAVPAALDLTTPAGARLRAIYKVEGDKLTVCRCDDPAGARPTEFAAKAGSPYTLLAFRRPPAKKE